MTAPRNDNDFHQLTGAFDRPIAPSPTFAEALKQRVQEEETTMQQVGTTPTRPVSHRTARATSHPLPRRKMLDVAIAAAVIVGMLSGTFWYASTRIGGDDPNNPGATHYAAQPLTSVTTPGAGSIQFAGDPGNINAWPAGFDPETDLEVTEFAEEITYPSYAIIAGDILVVQGILAASGEDEEPHIVAVDMETQAIQWSLPLTAKREFVTDGNSIFGFFSETGRTDITLMAIDIDDGEPTWRGPTFDGEETADLLAPIETMNLFGPTVVDQQLFFRTPQGEIVAVTATTGEQQWSLARDEGAADAGMTMPGSLVSDGRYLYDIDALGTVRKLNLANGSIESRIEPDIEQSASLAWIFATENTLLVVSKSRDSAPQYLHAVSPETGETLWSQPLGEVRPYITATSDVVAVPHFVPESLVQALDREIDEAGLYTSFFDLGTGELLTLQRPSTGDFATMSSSGDVVCINQGVAVSCTHTASEGRTLVTLPYAPGEGTYDPVMFHGDAAIIRGGERGLIMIQPTDAQPQQAVMFPGDPGHTSAWAEPFDISGGLYARELDGYPVYGASGTVIGDILIAENKRVAHDDPPTFSGTGIYAQDLTTGEILWRNTYQVHQRYTADDSGVYILPQPTTDIQRLIALDLTTGEERWRSDPLSTFSSIPDADGVLHAGTPIAIDGTVYLPMLDGVVLAFNGATGEIVWTYEGMTLNIENGDATIAGDENRIYTVAPDNVITVLDRETGALEHEFVLEDLPPSEYSLWPHAQADRLIIEARAKGDHEPGGMLVAVDPVSGDELWRQDTGVMVSNVVVTPDRVGVVHAAFDDPSVIERIFTDSPPDGTLAFSLFDLETGEQIEAPEDVLTQVDGVWSAALAASGDTICLGYTTVTCFDPDGNVVMVDGYETPHITTIGQELLFWNGRLVILNPLVPNHLAVPATPVSATPVETPVAATPMATPIATPAGTP